MNNEMAFIRSLWRFDDEIGPDLPVKRATDESPKSLAGS